MALPCMGLSILAIINVVKGEVKNESILRIKRSCP